METNYTEEEVAGGVPVKMWTRGVPVEDEAKRQLANAARLPIVFKHIAAMPDVHFGIGATVGSVIPTFKAIIPTAVGVDIGCGMIACKTTLSASDLPDNLAPLRSAIERAVPHGRAPGSRDPGAWNKVPGAVDTAWAELEPEFTELCRDYPKLAKTNNRSHLGTLGTGNHFIEVCLDEQGFVWFMLHSGSRGVGNAIGTMFIELAKQDALRNNANLPDRDLAYFEEGSRYFGDYVRAVGWAQKFARLNREVMMRRVIEAAKTVLHKNFQAHIEAVNCHHNYVQKETHFGQEVYVTRKGAVSAKRGELGIIPGCFAAGTRVLMANGLYKNIEDIQRGELVIAGDGSATKVTATFEHGVRKVWRYKNNAFHAETVATPDHRHFIGDMSTANLQAEGRIKIIDRLTVKGESKYKWLPLSDLRPSTSTLLMPRRVDFAQMPTHFNVTEFGLNFRPSYALGYVFGTFLGDGTAYYATETGGQISWSFGLGEREVAEKLMTNLGDLEIEAKLYRSKNCLLPTVHSANMTRVLERFNKKTKKAIPNHFWCRDPQYLRGLYDGIIDSDGHINNKTLKVTNTSTELIEQFGVIHRLLFGYWPSVSVREPSTGGLMACKLENCNPSYRSTSLRLPPLAKEHQLIELLWIEKEETEELVYDIEVEHDDHSFIANNAIVHNSMGVRSYIVRGKGNPESFESCSHGAGRAMSRGEAKRRFTLADHRAATVGVECRKDKDVIDETPAAYKDIDAVMAAQSDLVEVVHTLKQVVCVKG